MDYSTVDEVRGDERTQFEAWCAQDGRTPYPSLFRVWQAALAGRQLAGEDSPARRSDRIFNDMRKESAQQVDEVPGDALAMIGSNLRSILSLCKPEGQGISRIDAANVQHEARHALHLLYGALDGRDVKKPVAFVGIAGQPAWIHDGQGLGKTTATEVGTYLYDSVPALSDKDVRFENHMGSPAFETWASANGFSLTRDRSSGNYREDTLGAWMAWRHLKYR